MNKKFYISDLHFGHQKCIDFDKRPFKSFNDMNETMIQNWNSVVSKGDLVYVLGDMFWDNRLIPEIMPRLKGTKFLIKGNHDRISTEHNKYFEWIKDV